MNLRHLRYFLAVAGSGSFRKAAEKLHVAQPALTRQIAALERELGVSLFEPAARRRKLGPAGKLFARDARSVLTHLDDAVSRVREAVVGQQSKLRFGFVEVSSGDKELARLVKRLRAAMPGLEIEMVPMGSPEQVRDLLTDRIDAGCLCCLPNMDPRLSIYPLSEQAMVAALPKTHPLARKRRLLLRDLQDERLIFVSKANRADLRKTVLESFRRQGLHAPRTEEVNGSAQVISLVAVGTGVGLLMSVAKSRLPAGVVSRPIADFGATYRLAIVWKTQSKNSVAATLPRFLPPQPPSSTGRNRS